MALQSTTEENKRIVRAFIEAAFNQHQPALAGEYMTAGIKWHGGTLGTVEGRENFVGLIGAIVVCAFATAVALWIHSALRRVKRSQARWRSASERRTWAISSSETISVRPSEQSSITSPGSILTLCTSGKTPGSVLPSTLVITWRKRWWFVPSCSTPIPAGRAHRFLSPDCRSNPLQAASKRPSIFRQA